MVQAQPQLGTGLVNANRRPPGRSLGASTAVLPPVQAALGFPEKKKSQAGAGVSDGPEQVTPCLVAIDPEFLWDPKMSELAWKFPLCVRKTHLSLPSAELCCGRPYPSLGSSRWKDAPVGEEAEAFLR